jgi:hypothetical protein|tara:strand:- start:1340 stop:1549 length:210 start_codon:yes stop_codon:yes gene_type:complete
MQDEAVARSVMYLVAAVLLIVMFSLVGIFLQAELNEQAKLKAQNEGPIMVHSTPKPQSPRGFWGRSDKT